MGSQLDRWGAVFKKYLRSLRASLTSLYLSRASVDFCLVVRIEKTHRYSLVVVQIPYGLFEIADTTVNQLCTLTTGTGAEIIPLDNGHL